MAGAGDPFRKPQAGEPFVPSASQFRMFIEDAQARRSQGQAATDRVVSSLRDTLHSVIRNDLSADLKPFSVIRWQGGPVKSATLNGNVPPLVLKTAAHSATTKPIGVVGPVRIRKAAGGVTAGEGLVSTLGVTWARCLGPISDGDAIEPNSSYVGIKATTASPVIARGTLASGVQGIIPVFIGAGGGAAACQKKYQLFYLGSATGGSISLPVSAQYRDPDNGYIRSGAYTIENVSIPYNATTTQVKNAIEGHSYIDADEVTVTGSLSLTSANHLIVMPEGTYLGTGGTGELTNTLARSGLETPKAYLWECCS